MNREAASRASVIQYQRLNTFVANDAAGIDQTRLNVLPFEPRIAFEDCFGAVTRSEHPQDMFYGESPAANDGLPAKYLRVNCDSIQQFAFVHCQLLDVAINLAKPGRVRQLPETRTGRMFCLRGVTMRQTLQARWRIHRACSSARPQFLVKDRVACYIINAHNECALIREV